MSNKSLINEDILNEKIINSGITKTFIASELSLTRQGLDFKLSGKRPFKINEALKLCYLLRVDSYDEMCQIFLPYEVKKSSTSGDEK